MPHVDDLPPIHYTRVNVCLIYLSSSLTVCLFWFLSCRTPDVVNGDGGDEEHEEEDDFAVIVIDEC